MYINYQKNIFTEKNKKYNFSLSLSKKKHYNYDDQKIYKRYKYEKTEHKNIFTVSSTCGKS